MTRTYNTQDGWHDDYFDAKEYFDELDSEELTDKLILQEEDNAKSKALHRQKRQNDRKAKAHQIELATTLGKQRKGKRKSLYRWSPVWHKMKLADVSKKKFKERFDDSFIKNALKEFNTI